MTYFKNINKKIMIKCKRQYRIVTDKYAGFEVQKRVWYFPFWLQIGGIMCGTTNTSYTIEEAEELIELNKTNSIFRKKKCKVVKTFKCE